MIANDIIQEINRQKEIGLCDPFESKDRLFSQTVITGNIGCRIDYIEATAGFCDYEKVYFVDGSCLRVFEENNSPMIKVD